MCVYKGDYLPYLLGIRTLLENTNRSAVRTNKL